MHDQLLLSAAIFAQWWLLVASSEALDLLHQAMHAVTYRQIAMAIKMDSKVGVFYFVVSIAVAPATAGAIWSK
jgi:hypothetical protein